MGNYIVYWIKCCEHNNYSTQGYVGITKNVSKRFKQHRTRACNPHFQNAINLHGWDNLVKEVLACNLDKEAAELVELMLRPTRNIGWNVNEGGLAVPSNLGYKITEPQRLVFSRSKQGQKNPANKLSPCDVISIYVRSLTNERSVDIASSFGISDTTVAKIKYLRKQYYRGIIENYLRKDINMNEVNNE